MKLGRYWVDANVFIWGSNVPYPFLRAQGYWNWFSKQIHEGTIVTHVRVYEEVIKGNPKGRDQPIIPWVVKHRDCGLRIRSEKEHQLLVGQVCEKAFEMYSYAKATEFLKGADPYLIAHASLDSGTVVTQESRRKERRIPEMCKEFDVDYVDLYEMNERLKAQYGA